MTAETALLEAQRSALDLRTRRLLADVGMVRALGGGWNTDDLPSAQDETAANVDGSGSRCFDPQRGSNELWAWQHEKRDQSTRYPAHETGA